ncbi:GNAT family N-acetyltransferase [Anoxybacillus sp. KU2-6(11)]|uniref:GNAT family N-acetyltransferase n=1 Tax=Anoxybacillus sp. KU2-6(11) TaxID=1535751 RepID=UPI001E65233F|nr:GNAT family N-acetyltransferase [Anoxybacillus sp. KU2-6(11)]
MKRFYHFHHKHYWKVHWAKQKTSDEKVKQLIEPLLQKGSYYLIATEGDNLMGWILIGKSKDQFTEKIYGFIYELFVLEEFRGNGISKQLVEAGIEHLKQDGYSEIRLSVYAGSQAIKLYEKLGFKSIYIQIEILTSGSHSTPDAA